jgi:hypothetical protein
MSRFNPRTCRGVAAWKVIVVVFLVLVLVCAGVVTYLLRNARRMAAGWVRDIVVAEIQDSSLADQQKDALTNTLNQLADDFEAGGISLHQIGMIGAELAEGPFMTLVFVEVVQARHIETVQLDEQQREEVALTFDRFERGIYEGTIPRDEVEKTLTIVADTNEEGGLELKGTLTETELSAFVDEMKEKADEAKVPDEPYQVDFAGMLQETIHQVLGTAPTTAPASPDTPATAPAASMPGEASQ